MKFMNLRNVLAGLALCLSATSQALVTPVELVQGTEPSKYETKALEELQLFWEQIYGKKLDVVQTPTGKPAIYIGKTDFAAKNAPESAECGREEWLLKTVGNDLVISGGRPVGTLYGVYAVLEKLGVGFIDMDETVIPKPLAEFPAFNERRKPDFEGRLLYDSIAIFLHRCNASEAVRNDYKLWLLRNRINGMQIKQVEPYYVGGLYNMAQPSQYHSFSDFINPSLFDEHPEYFGMDAFGVRQKPGNYAQRGTICMTNPDVRRITLEKLREYIKKDHSARPHEECAYIYDISALDNAPNFCLCPECKKIIDFEGSQTGLLLDYINYVATEIKKEYPEIIIRTFGYSASKVPPVKIKPAENVLIQLTDSFTVSNPFKPLETQTSTMMDYFSKWCACGAPMMVWDYWNIGGNTYYKMPRVETVFDALQPDIRFFRKNNFIAMFVEAEEDHVSPQCFLHLNHYVANMLMVDADADVEALAKQFIDGFYGPAAPVMLKYFNLIRDGIRKDDQPASTAVAPAWKFANPQFVFDMRKELLDAVKALPEGSRFAARVHRELISPLWFAVANWPSFESLFGAIGMDKQMLIDEVHQFSKEFYARYECKNPEYGEKEFETKMAFFKEEYIVPDRFKNIPAKDFRMVTSNNFGEIDILFSSIVKDPDSFQGSALMVNDKREDFVGVNKLLPGPHGFITTEFVLGNHKAPGRLRRVLKSVPTDEKYHWFRIPGSIELRSPCYFWGDNWAIQANVSNWYMLTDGNPLDNTWDQVWFSAKFTGPAYVPGSTQENRIYVDMVCVVRNQPDPLFKEYAEYPALDDEKAWSVNGYYKNTGSVKIIEKDDAKMLEVTASKDNTTAAQGPIVPCTSQDMLRLRVRNGGETCQAGFYFFNDKGFVENYFVKLPANGLRNEIALDLTDLKHDDVTRCRVVFMLSAGEAKATFEDIELSVAREE